MTFGGHAGCGQRVGQVSATRLRKVVHEEFAPLMDLLHPGAPVWGSGHKRDLKSSTCACAQAAHVRTTLKKADSWSSSKHTNIEVLDDDFDGLMPADLM